MKKNANINVVGDKIIPKFLPANKISHEALPFLPGYFISVAEKQLRQRSR